MSAFNKSLMLNWHEPEFDVRSQEKNRFFTVVPPPMMQNGETVSSEPFYLEAVICKYETSQMGGMQKVTEKVPKHNAFSMPGDSGASSWCSDKAPASKARLNIILS